MVIELPENWSDLLKPIETKEGINILEVLRDGPSTLGELATRLNLSIEETMYHLSQIASAPDLDLKCEYTEDHGSEKVFSVNPESVNDYLTAVEYLREKFSQ